MAVPATVQGQSESKTVNFQSCLFDSSGAAVEDNVYAIRLLMYADSLGGEPLWQTSGFTNVETVNGCFRHALGTTNPLPDSIGNLERMWVGLVVGTSPELRPRTLITTGATANPPAVAVAAVPESPASTQPASSTKRKGKPPATVYVHFLGSFGLGSISRGDVYRALVDPLTPGLGVGYSVGFGIGFRNIYQFEYRPRSVGSVSLKYSDADITVPMDFHLSNQYVHKLNLLAWKGTRGSVSQVLFLCYGWSGDGTVKHVDEASDGFKNGSSHLWGLEYGILGRSSQFLLILERNAVKFQEFEITGIGTFVGEIEASYWYVGGRIGFGLAF